MGDVGYWGSWYCWSGGCRVVGVVGVGGVGYWGSWSEGCRVVGVVGVGKVGYWYLWGNRIAHGDQCDYKKSSSVIKSFAPSRLFVIKNAKANQK